ncbi:iron siderophore-binding protein [Rhodococcus oryzae]|uniref:Iron siderophore-binding protein n=1 Tax=Rhodococcus oryzae TaxID=2571143 RepID=A0ABY2RQN4_9NOCA|nr:ABC transporter substrate-binding protein [Rhodococcus oryzae]TJZ80288.1 iron siderophore-binding protein [Rhodococcus oryzae]
MSSTSSPLAARKGRRVIALIGLLAIAVAAIAGCGSGAETEAAEPQTRVIETAGGPVTVPAAAERIVVLSGGLAGYLYALEAPVVATDTRVLGVTNFDGGFPPAWSAKAIAQGTTELPAGEQLNIEAVAAADPDLIIGGGQGVTSVQAEELHDQLAAIAPTVLIPKTVTSWKEQLRLVAEAAGRSDRVQAMMTTYDDRVAQVRSAIAVPEGPTVYLLSVGSDKPFLIPPAAALPEMLGELGFAADDVLSKAGNPPLFGSGDSFEVSPELLSTVADAPVAFVVPVSGRALAELAQDPLYARLPAIARGKAFELPATSYRPDYDGVMATLDVIEKSFG